MYNFMLLVDGADTMKDAFSSALTTIQSDVLGYAGVALPIGLALFAAFFGVKKGISFFQSIGRKG